MCFCFATAFIPSCVLPLRYYSIPPSGVASLPLRYYSRVRSLLCCAFLKEKHITRTLSFPKGRKGVAKQTRRDCFFPSFLFCSILAKQTRRGCSARKEGKERSKRKGDRRDRGGKEGKKQKKGFASFLSLLSFLF